jgi:hypothetical protein
MSGSQDRFTIDTSSLKRPQIRRSKRLSKDVIIFIIYFIYVYLNLLTSIYYNSLDIRRWYKIILLYFIKS